MPSSELAVVANAHDLTDDEMRRLQLNALRASFAPYEVREAIEATHFD